MMQIDNDKTSRLYRVSILYTLILIIIAAIANYFTWDTVYESAIVNAFLLVLTIAMWIALYIPVPVLMIKADWKISDFGFVINKSTFIASLAVGALMFIRLGWTFRFDLIQYTIIEAFARVGEELFFRGFIFTLALKLLKGKENSVLWAILISSVLFAIVHTQTFLPSNHLTMIDIFISGLIMVIIRYFTGSILPGIITHLAGNAGVLGMGLGILIYCMVIIVVSVRRKKSELKIEPCTELVMVRHAQVEYTPNDKERALSKEGKEQRNDVLDILLHKDIDRIYSSPYVRAIDTIKPYAELKNIDIQIIDNLRERKVSDHFIDDFKNYAIKQWADFDYKLMHGESLREVQERAVLAIDEIVRDNKGKRIVVGTHGTFLCVLLNHYDKKYDYTFWNNLNMPAIISIKLDGHGVVNNIDETQI